MKIKFILITAALLLSLTSCDVEDMSVGKNENTGLEVLLTETQMRENDTLRQEEMTNEQNLLPDANIPNIDDTAIKVPDGDENSPHTDMPVKHNLSWVDWLNRELISRLSENISDTPAIFIESTDELKEFLEATENSIDLSSEHNEIISFEDAQNYDEKYFEKYSLLIVYSGEHSGSLRHRIKDFSGDNDTLSIDIESYYPSNIATKDLTGRLLLFTFEKEAAEGFDNIDVNIINSACTALEGDQNIDIDIDYNLSLITQRREAVIDKILSGRKKLITNIEELGDFLEAAENTVDLSEREECVVSFEDAREFDESYFDKYVLLIVYSGEHSSSDIHEITGISCENNTLSVALRRYSPDGGSTFDITGKLLLFTFEKSDVAECTDVDIIWN